MRKNKSGFTLIELLAVLAIIAILTVVIFPNFLSIKNDQKGKFNNSLKVVIFSAAKVYVANNKEDIDEKIIQGNGKYCMAIGTLKAYDYVSIPMYDPVTKEKIDLSRCVYISKEENQTDQSNIKVKYKYELSETDTKNGDYIPPVIKLQEINGEPKGTCTSTMSIKSRDEFDKKCIVVATDNIDENIKIEGPITIQKPLVNGSDGIYIYKYIAKDSNGNTAKELRVKLIVKQE